MFRIKICGVTSLEDAELVVRAGADAIGLNFWPGSRRHVDRSRARELADALGMSVVKVGVFVDADDLSVRSAVEEAGLDWVQWHGDEPPERVALWDGPPLIKALRLGSAGVEPIRKYLDRCAALGRLPNAVLVDADVRGQFGGTGRTVDWRLLNVERGALRGLPLILAGGLTEANVAEAISLVRPDAVDTASGVERSLGHKDPERVARFVVAAREAFAALDTNPVFRTAP